MPCARCQKKLPGNGMICKECFNAWPKGKTLYEYLGGEIKPEPVKFPAGLSTMYREPRIYEKDEL